MTKLTNFLVLFLVLNFSSYSQNFLSTSGSSIVNENGDTIIFRGMGLGGWMVQEGYMMAPGGFSSTQYQIKDRLIELIGEEETDVFYHNWLSNHVRKIDIDSITNDVILIITDFADDDDEKEHEVNLWNTQVQALMKSIGS